MSYPGLSLQYFRARLLDVLHAPPDSIWTDTQLDQCITQALTLHSYTYPSVGSVYQALQAGQKVIYVAYGAFIPVPLTTLPTSSPLLPVPPPAGEEIMEEPELPPVANADFIGITRVECPRGTILPYDPGLGGDPSASRPTRTRQAYRTFGPYIYLNNPASGAEVSPDAIEATFYAEGLWTYSIPTGDPGILGWDGPLTDLPLIFLWAERRAWELFQGWASYILYDPVPDFASVLANLDIQIAAALKARRGRQLHSRTLDL